MRAYFILALFVFVLALGVPGQPCRAADGPEHRFQPPLLPPELAARLYGDEYYVPPLMLEPFTDGDGKTVDLSAAQGKWVLVNFWAASCAGCLWEIPLLLELEKKIDPADFDVMFISVEFAGIPYEISEFVPKADFFSEIDSVYLKDQQVVDALDITGVPTSFLIGPDGGLYYRLAGEIDWSGPDAAAFVDGLIESAKKTFAR